MRVLLVNNHENMGGKERYLQAVARMLRSAGHVTGLIHSMPGTRGIERDHIAFYVPGIESYQNTSQTIQRLRGITGLFGPDIIHVHHNARNLFAVNWLMRHYPVLRSVHDVEYLCPTRYYLRADTHAQCDARCGTVCFSAGCLSLTRPRSVVQLLRKRIEQRLYSRSAGLNTQSAYLQQHLLQTGRHLKVGVLPVFVETVELLPLPESVRFLFVGRLHRLKGPQVAIEAISRLPVFAHLDIVGAGQMEGELCEKVQVMNLDSRVHFTGYLTGQALKDRYAQASCVVVPSVMAENCPLSVQEAMTYGRPVIASNVGGVGELVTDGVTGFLVPPADPIALSNAMTRVCNREVAAQLGKAGLDQISALKYSAAYHLKQLEQQYSETVARFRI